MLAKNGKLHVRHIGGTICEVLLPLILVGLGSLTVYLYLSLIEPLNSLGGYG